MSSPKQTGSGRLVGVDYGRRRIGIAISDAGRLIATPMETYQRQSTGADQQYFRRLAEENDAAGWVVGVPVHMSGEEGEMATEARRFGAWLAEATELPVHFWDERYSSAEADRYLREGDLSSRRRRARRDMIAAQILLQSYLDCASGESEGTGALDD